MPNVGDSNFVHIYRWTKTMQYKLQPMKVHRYMCEFLIWFWDQCDQVGLLLKSFGYILSYKIVPEIWQLFVLFQTPLFWLKTSLATFWASVLKNGPLLILSSGHTVWDSNPGPSRCRLINHEGNDKHSWLLKKVVTCKTRWHDDMCK